MIPRSQRPHFIRTLTHTHSKPQPPTPKNRMLCLLLKRIVQSKLRHNFQQVQKYGEMRVRVLGIGLRRVERNLEFCKLMAWKKLGAWGKLRKMGDGLVKFVGIASERVRMYGKARAFRAIKGYGEQRCVQSIKNLQSYKTKMLKFAINKIWKRVMSQPILKLKLNSLKQSARSHRHKLLPTSLQTLLARRISQAWTKILTIQNSQQNDIEHQLGQLNKEMNNLKKELARKDNQIVVLELEISSRREERRYEEKFNSYGGRESRVANRSLENSRRSMKSIGSRRGSSQDISEKGSVQNGNASVLSWLNGSFMSGRSGKSSMSRSITGLDCYCKYRQKYNQYKAETSSLKNQLQIIKSQLEVTKDLNEHLQEQISNLCLNPKSSAQSQSQLELEILRKEVKDLRRERELMKDKIIHNQKYIANLKCQFKNKIEGLYRNLRKGNNN